MHQKIKELADEAVALQNKDRMHANLLQISDLCGAALQAAEQQDQVPAVVPAPAEQPASAKKGGTK